METYTGTLILMWIFPEMAVQESHQIAYIVRPVECNFVWGMKHVVQLVDPVKIKQFDWLVKDVSPGKDRLHTDPNYSVSSIHNQIW